MTRILCFRLVQLLLIALISSASGACGHGLYRRAPYLPPPAPARAAVEASILLVGDAGLEREPPQVRALLESVRSDAAAHPRSTIVWLGDNIYPDGMPVDEGSAERRRAEAILRRQIEAVPDMAESIFVPGNHDWRREGLERVRAQARFIADEGGDAGRIRMLPEAGCPGPVGAEASPDVLVIAIDTEWLLARSGSRAQAADAGTSCGAGREGRLQPMPHPGPDAVYAALQDLISSAAERYILVVAHHPLRTRGLHGGYWLAGPVPIVWPAIRRAFLRDLQDLWSAPYREMRRQLEHTFQVAGKPLLAFAAGHEHNLQVFTGSGGVRYHLVSGSGSKRAGAGRSEEMLFKRGELGYMKLDFVRNGDVYLEVVEIDSSGARQIIFQQMLNQS
jgi:hypothetical protein